MPFKREHWSDADIISKRLAEGRYGVLSLVDASGFPYGVPLNYVYDETNRALYFHSKQQGRKMTAICRHSTAHFSIVLSETVVPHIFTTNYESIFLEGKVHEVTDDEERHRGLLLLCERFAPHELSRRDEVIQKEWSRVAVLRFDITSMSGKSNQDS